MERTRKVVKLFPAHARDDNGGSVQHDRAVDHGSNFKAAVVPIAVPPCVAGAAPERQGNGNPDREKSRTRERDGGPSLVELTRVVVDRSLHGVWRGVGSRSLASCRRRTVERSRRYTELVVT